MKTLSIIPVAEMGGATLAQLCREAGRLPFRVEVVLPCGSGPALPQRVGPFVVMRRATADGPAGRSGALRAAVMQATGDLVLLIGPDGSVPLAEVLQFVPRFERGAQAVIGSRYLGQAGMARHPWYRRLGHALVNYAVRVVMLRGVRDSRCAFKCFSAAAARHLFSLVGDSSPSPELEALGLAQRLGYNLVEVPVGWQPVRRGVLAGVGQALVFLPALLRVRWRVGGQRYRRPLEGTA